MDELKKEVDLVSLYSQFCFSLIHSHNFSKVETFRIIFISGRSQADFGRAPS